MKLEIWYILGIVVKSILIPIVWLATQVLSVGLKINTKIDNKIEDLKNEEK